ncbi:MAG: AAA family ATPase [Propionicimonas sp.]
MSTNDLSAALTKLVRAAEKAGIDPAQAGAEGRQLAAAIAESNRGAFVDWSAAVGLPPAAAAFFEAAQKGRRYRSSATPTASQASASGSRAAAAYRQALVEVCTAAALLGETGPQSLGAAQLAAAAQRGATAPLRPSSPMPGATGAMSLDESQRRFERHAPTILNDVLQRLSESSERLLDLNRVDAHGPGAIPGLGATAPRFPTPQDPPAPARVPGAPAGTPAPSPTPPAEPALAEPPEPAEPDKTVEEWLAELDELIGLSSVKSEIRRQTAILRVDALRTKAGLKSPTITRHLIFTGNPGTGKTTVARMVAGIYKAIGLLTKGQLVEVDRSELVAGYLGQTAMKTAEVVGKAIGGVLFIDEAYALNGDQYGDEAINTLVKEMEDNRNDLVVIVAGYPAPMSAFISQNPGLASRFRTEIEFQDYTDDELARIFTQMATKADYDLGVGCLAEFGRQLAAQVRDETFGNGRFARNVFEAAIGKHAWRLREIAEPSLEQLRVLLPEDLAPEPQPTVAWPVSDETPAQVPPS